MKQKIIQLQQRADVGEEKTRGLEDEMHRLKTENLKLSTDMKIMRSE
jgi:hypothetical protein